MPHLGDTYALQTVHSAAYTKTRGVGVYEVNIDRRVCPDDAMVREPHTERTAKNSPGIRRHVVWIRCMQHNALFTNFERIMDWLHILVLGWAFTFAVCLPYCERSFALVTIGLRVGASMATGMHVLMTGSRNMLLSSNVRKLAR